MSLNTNRRSMLAGSLALTAASFALPKMAFAQAPGDKNLLFVLLRGAADGLAMLAPIGDPALASLRGPALSEYEGARRADGFFAIHPAYENVGSAFASGEALFVHATATMYRERSHFDGQNLLETGATTPFAKTDGWLNRLVAMMALEAGNDHPRALAIAPSLPLALRGNAPASSYAPSALPQASEAFMERVALLYEADTQLESLFSQALETQAMAADDSLRNLRDAQATGELAASLMRTPDGARIAMMELGGWDTHANQTGAFRRVSRQLDTLLGAYRTGMGSAWANTMVVVVTEFGRTVRLNGTNGTDHGTGSAALIMGGGVKGGQVIADWPGLSPRDLYENRDLRPTIALENVLAGAVSEHFRLNPRETLARLFPEREGTALSGVIRA